MGNYQKIESFPVWQEGFFGTSPIYKAEDMRHAMDLVSKDQGNVARAEYIKKSGGSTPPVVQVDRFIVDPFISKTEVSDSVQRANAVLNILPLCVGAIISIIVMVCAGDWADSLKHTRRNLFAVTAATFALTCFLTRKLISKIQGITDLRNK